MEKEGQATIKLLSPPFVLCNSLALENSVKRAVDISFRRAAKNCIIPLNGRLALKFDPGQPHKSDSLITVVLSACSTPLYKAKGAFDKLLRICVAALLKEISTAR